MRVLAVGGHKGGTTKTTTAVHVAAAWARRGAHVALVDLDAQGGATRMLLGRTLADGDLGTAAVLAGDATLEAAAVEAPGGVAVVGGGPALVRVELALAGELGREAVLSDALAATPAGTWDAVVLDCPPALALLAVNALVAADLVLVPVPPAYLALAAVRDYGATVETVRRRLNRRLRGPLYFLAAVDGRETAAAEARAVLAAHAGEDLLRQAVRVDARLKAAPAAGRLPTGRGARDLADLADEVFKRLNVRASERADGRSNGRTHVRTSK